MNSLPVDGTVLAASTVTTIGAVIAVLVGIGSVLFLVANLRAGRPEVGSEVELAPNRKPYLDDEQLETVRLNRTLRWALSCMVRATPKSRIFSRSVSLSMIRLAGDDGSPNLIASPKG